MYDIIRQIIDHTWTTNSSEQQYIYYCCIVLILLLTVVFVDLIKSVFAAYMPKR